MKNKKLSYYFLILFLISCSFIRGKQEQALAFPGAEGFGKYATGGRGGIVAFVTNLDDEGDGSLRHAIRKHGPRIIVFTVSGNIELESPLDINNPDITIAGQSAPGQGICIKNYSVNVKADNVIIRYMRFRMGDEKKYEGDAIGGNSEHKNIIIDHCSVSWSTDECASFYRNHNFTMQWCIIAESLNNSIHSKGPHGYGGIWGGEGATYHHNLLASNNSRNPRFSGSSTTRNPEDELVDFSNNVIFNWGFNSSYGGEKGSYNMENNYYKPGPATEKSKRSRILNPWMPYGKFYINGNVLEGNAEVSADNWKGVEPEKNGILDSFKVIKPFEVMQISLQTAEDALESVLQKAGANLFRDEADSRIVREVISGEALYGPGKNGIIDSQKDVGGWPELKSETPLADTDQDGIPDEWEVAHKLNPEKDDSKEFTLNKNYSNIEMYLNSLVEKIR